MATPSKTLVNLETRFWQSMVDEDIDAALKMLAEPALMVSALGAMKFDHDGYRKMAAVLTAFELSGMDVTFANEHTAILTYRVKQGVANRGNGNGHGDASMRQMNDSSTWVRDGRQWKCVMHTETPAEAA